VWLGQVWPGGHGKAGSDEAGSAWAGSGGHGMAWPGPVWRREARRSRQGLVRKVWPGPARRSRYGRSWRGRVGMAGPGPARRREAAQYHPPARAALSLWPLKDRASRDDLQTFGARHCFITQGPRGSAHVDRARALEAERRHSAVLSDLIYSMIYPLLREAQDGGLWVVSHCLTFL
jgi:hypothetical protein